MYLSKEVFQDKIEGKLASKLKHHHLLGLCTGSFVDLTAAFG